MNNMESTQKIPPALFSTGGFIDAHREQKDNRLNSLLEGKCYLDKELMLIYFDNDDQGLVHRFIEHVYEHYHDHQLTIDEISKRLFVSKKQLERKVKQATGISPKLLINRFRLGKAVILLRNGVKPSQVYAQVGFSSMPYFSRCFKVCFAVTPCEYIRTL